jgi:hypothetical protein
MRAFAKIIVEEKDGQWSAWFSDAPQIVEHDNRKAAMNRMVNFNEKGGNH